jgi:jasmonate ZIM domain-containing protein
MDSASAASRFAVAWGLLNQYVETAEPAPRPKQADWRQKLMILYRGRVAALDGNKPAKAAEIIMYAEGASFAPVPEPVPALVDMPVAVKASLQRFLSKRKERSMYSRLEESAPPPLKKGKTEASSWLSLGSLGDIHAQ